MFWFATVPTKDAPLPNTPVCDAILYSCSFYICSKKKYILQLHVCFNLLAPKPKQLAEVKKWLAHSAFPASEWHAPIADMIAHTPAEALEARAVPRPSLFERAHAPSESAARIALIGDASHPIACNLAQGAAIAIEDAYCLAAELIPLFSAQQPIGSNPSHDAVRVAIATFDSARSRRVASNRAVTYFTAALSAPRSDLGETLRDLPLRMTMRLSAPLNAAVFDASLSVSLGGESYRLPSLPQL